MKKKTSGIDDLVSTLVKQHGLVRAIERARFMVHSLTDTARLSIWRITLQRLKDMRP